MRMYIYCPGYTTTMTTDVSKGTAGPQVSPADSVEWFVAVDAEVLRGWHREWPMGMYIYSPLGAGAMCVGSEIFETDEIYATIVEAVV